MLLAKMETGEGELFNFKLKRRLMMKKNAEIAEAASIVGWLCFFFLFLWGYGQIADPFGYSLIARIPNKVALAVWAVAFFAAIVSWRFEPKSKNKSGSFKRQTIKEIKSGRKRIFF